MRSIPGLSQCSLVYGMISVICISGPGPLCGLLISITNLYISGPGPLWGLLISITKFRITPLGVSPQIGVSVSFLNSTVPQRGRL